MPHAVGIAAGVAVWSTKVAAGAEKADEAGAALGEILRAVEVTVGQVSQIAAAAQEMAAGAHGVVEAMGVEVPWRRGRVPAAKRAGTALEAA